METSFFSQFFISIEKFFLRVIFIMGTLTPIFITIFVLFIIFKNKNIRRLQKKLTNMEKTFNDLDEQAKLIVKTDLELNKAQEELDKQLNSLDALQKTSRLISTTLDENEIFQRLDQSLMVSLGFEKILIFIENKNKELLNKVALGFSHKNIPAMLSELKKDPSIIKELKEGKTLSSINLPKQKREFLAQIFDVCHFVLTPIMTQNGIIGISFAGNQSDIKMTEGDEELISILADQIGQSLENARLFEEAFRSSQILESKVQNRTQQLEKALKDVQDINKTKSEFISAVSHELRTPLTSIKGYASILMAGKLGDIPDEVKKRLEKINVHSDNLVALINNLLDIARIESGRVGMKKTSCCLCQLAENAFDLLMPQMKSKKLQGVLRCNKNIQKILLDSNQIERVFINLLSNAIKFTPNEGTISIKIVLNNGIFDINVSDTGTGIPQEDIPRLFDEFYRVENRINENVKGTGLGLALVKKIIEAHQGKIGVTSEQEKGTTFHFTLPIPQEM